MKPIDRLYMWSLILTLGATCLMFTGVLLPNWWLQKNTAGVTTRIFGLFGSIHCGLSVCYPDDQLPVSQSGHESTLVTDPGVDGSTPTTDPTERNGSTLVSTSVSDTTSAGVSTVAPDNTALTVSTGARTTNVNRSRIPSTSTQDRGNTVSPVSTSLSAYPASPEPLTVERPPTGWLVAGRVFGAIGLTLVTITLLLQMAYLLFPHRRFQTVSLGFLVAAALVSYITGFIFINKFSALTRVYVTERPPGALTFTAAAPGCMLISSLLCVVAAVLTLMAFRPPGGNGPSSTKKTTHEKTTPSNPSALPTSEGEAGRGGDEDHLLV